MLAVDVRVLYPHLSNRVAEDMAELKSLRDSHSLWSNPLLKACEAGMLKLIDFKLVFSEYYLYSKNFSRLIAALMTNCENDYFRSKLAENLWEESGEKELEQRHAEIFRRFLASALKINLTTIEFKSFTRHFAESYMALCKEMPVLEASAALSLGTEGIVSKLYAIFKNGLLSAGLNDDELSFFNIHIACDDDHALTLEEILISFSHEKDWFERTKKAMFEALDLRDAFFHALYEEIVRRNVMPLIDSASHAENFDVRDTKLVFDTSYGENPLYHNKNDADNINFQVQRLPFDAEVLDPRLVIIPAGSQNEYHEHAHETVILILEGDGEVIIAGRTIAVAKDNIIYVPRWLKHQTRNTGDKDLKFFAITDYGFTRQIPLNSESSYRKVKENTRGLNHEI